MRRNWVARNNWCPYCQAPLLPHEASVALLGGGVAHVTCTEADAAQARRRRRHDAWAEGVALLLVYALLWLLPWSWLALALAFALCLVGASYGVRHAMYWTSVQARLLRWYRVHLR